MKGWLVAAIATTLVGCSGNKVNNNLISNNATETPITRVIEKSIPRYATVGEHYALVLETSPGEFSYDTAVKQKPTKLEDFIREYNPDLIVGCGFYDPSTKTMVGTVKRNGETLAYGIWPPVGAKLYYKDGCLQITDSVDKVESDFEINDLLWLVRKGQIYVDEKRKVGFDLNVARTAFGTNGDKYFLVSYTGTVEELADLMLKLGSHDAVGFDAGENRAFAFQGRILKRGNNDPEIRDFPSIKNPLMADYQ